MKGALRALALVALVIGSIGIAYTVIRMFHGPISIPQ